MGSGEPALRTAPAEEKGQDCWHSAQCWLTSISASKMATDPLLGELSAWRSAESLAELSAYPPEDSDNDVPEEVPTPQLVMHMLSDTLRYIKW